MGALGRFEERNDCIILVRCVRIDIGLWETRLIHVSRSPAHPEVEAVKRVIGLEGDVVFTRKPFPNPHATVPTGHIWVEGDGGHNGKESLDSNTYGPIPMNLVTGRVTYALWPWRTFGPINWWEWKPKTRVIKAKR